MNLVDRIQAVSGGCPLKWEQLTGGDEVRSCSHCQKNVHNLSALTRSEANSLISSHGADLCIAFSAGADGKMISRPESKRWRQFQYFLRYGLAASIGILLPGCSTATKSKELGQSSPNPSVGDSSNSSKDICVVVGGIGNFLETESLPAEKQGTKSRPFPKFLYKKR